MKYISTDFENEKEWQRYCDRIDNPMPYFVMKKGFNPKDVQDRDFDSLNDVVGVVSVNEPMRFTKDGITVEVGDTGPINCYKDKVDTTFPFDRDDDMESTIYNILIKGVTHITTIESVRRDTKAILEAFNAQRVG